MDHVRLDDGGGYESKSRGKPCACCGPSSALLGFDATETAGTIHSDCRHKARCPSSSSSSE